MLSQQPNILNHDIVRNIRETCSNHPKHSTLKETGCTVVDDEGWKIYKKMIAYLAKERRQKANIKTVTQKKVRTKRDENFEPISYDTNRIVRICVDTYNMKRMKLEDIQESTTYVNNVIKCLRGDISTFDGYFWI